MIKSFLILFSVTLATCNKNVMPQDGNDNLKLYQTIVADGIVRDYHIYIPNDPTGKPLVLLLHGHGGKSDDVIGETNVRSPQKVWLSVAEQDDFIVVVPNGSIGSDNKRGWNDCRSGASGNPTTNDVSFISQLLEKIHSEYGHNENKVFVAGISNGGHMATRLALEVPDKITAFAAVVSAMPEESNCANSIEPVSALYMNGTADPILPYEGGEMAGNRGSVKSTEESVAYWINRNGITASPLVTDFADTNTGDKSTATKYHYKNGTNNTEVILYRIDNGGHTEPSITERYRNLFLLVVGNQNADLEMATEIWGFFKDKSK